MFKSIVSAAVMASALFAYGASITVTTKMGDLAVGGSNYTASSLEYKASPSNSSAPYRTQTGWYAGLNLAWSTSSSNRQRAADTKAKVEDGGKLNSQDEYTVYYLGDKTPSGCGMKNSFQLSGLTQYMKTTEWYIYVTPEFMYSLNGEDYSATLTIGGNTYAITVPHDIVLNDGSHQWYPAVGLLGEKVYGEAQYLADQITLDNYTMVKFLSDPVGVTFGDGFAASDNGDGTWGVTMTHSHAWTYSVDGATLTATCGNGGCPVGGSTTVSLTLSGSDKVYDNKAITASADFDSSFKTIFPDAEATISTTKDGEPIDNDKIKDAGEYVVTMTVTGLSGGQSRDVSRTVTISKVVIADAMLSFTPANQTYNGTEQTVTPSVNANGLAATIVVDTENSITSATEMGTYSVTVNGTGNFTGSATATWSIVNTTGSLKGVTPTVDGIGSIVNENSTNTLTIANSKALEYSNGSWFAGITLEWPVETKDWKSNSDSSSYAHYVTEDSVKVSIDDGITHSTSNGTYKTGRYSSSNFDYLSTTTWKVEITPAVVEEALNDGKDALEWEMRVGAIQSSTYANGVAFADYTITLSLDEPVEFVLGEGESYDLGDAVLTTTMIKLAAGASVTCDEAQTEGLIYTDVTGYGVVSIEDDGKYIYTAELTHVHDWTYSVDGATLTATCGAAECTVEGNATTVSLNLSSGDKDYDNTAIAVSAVFDGSFKTVFPDADATISTTKDGEPIDNDEIKDAGEYVVTMTVTGLSGGQSRDVSRTVTISPVDISASALELTPATTTYNGQPQTVTASVIANNMSATIVVDTENSITSATEMGTYSVTVNGAGNFAGSATATWSIVNTTGSLSGVTSAVSGIGDYDSENNTLTVSDSTALEYSDGAWYAGLTLTWPMTALNVSLNPVRDGSADYVKPEKMQLTIDGNVYTGSEILSGEAVYSAGKLAAKVSTDTYKYYESLFSQPTKQFEYLATTTWKVALTPAIIEAALANDEAELVYTMNAGAFMWEDGREGDSDGVAFADYAITLPLDEPVVFVLGKGETYDLGSTVLTATKIQLAAGASVTSEAAQTEGAIFTVETGYDIECTESDGVYTYTAKFTHVHDWSVSKAKNGYELVATCANPECDINGGEVRMWLDVGITEKTYDGNSVTSMAEFGEGFMTVYPDAAAVLTVNGVENGVINNAGKYDVKLTVTGVGEETYTLSRTVTISQVDISSATLVLTPATTTYNGSEQTVVPSVITVGGVTATLENNGLELASGTCTATEIGTYPVTVNGIGNFTGTPASATWEIVNTTGEPVSVTESAAGSMTNEGNVFTLTDSSKLEYDAENKVWYAGITITWPMETHKSWGVVTDVDYVTEDMVKVTKEYGEVDNVTEDYTYLVVNTISYVKTTTWKVGITPAIVEAALGEEKTVLEWTMRAGAIPSDTYEAGVAFRDYTITIPLNEDLKLYDGDGKQVYPMTPGQTIIEEIKSDIAEAVSGEVAADASAKIDLLAEVAGEGNEQDVADWVDGMKGENPAEFFEELAQCDYVKASFKLETDELITDVSAVEVPEFEATEGGFTFAVRIDGGDIEAALVKAARIINVGTDLGSFGPLSAERIEISGECEMTVEKDASAGHEFFKIVIDKDDEVD